MVFHRDGRTASVDVVVSPARMVVATKLIVARADGPVGELTPAAFESPALRERLQEIGIRSMSDLQLTRIGSKAIMTPLIRSFTTAANSDYYPVLDLGAARARFLGHDAFALLDVAPTAWLLEGRRPDGRTPISPDHPLARRYARAARQAQAIGRYFESPRGAETGIEFDGKTLSLVRAVRSIHDQCDATELELVWVPQVCELARRTIPFLNADAAGAIWRDIRAAPCFADLPSEIRDLVGLLEAVSRADHEMVVRLSRSVLGSGAIEARPETSFLVWATMLAQLALHDREAARALWERYDDDKPPMFFRLLAAHAWATDEPVNQGRLAEAAWREH